MKKAAFIITLFLSTLIVAQNPESSTMYEKAYNDIMNYVPKNLEFGSDLKPENKLLQTELNSIGSLKLYYDFIEQFKLNDADVKWLENRINQLTIALFLDGKRILIKPIGGYEGCPKKMIELENQNGIDITILKFCFTCTENKKNGEKFIKIFNERMNKLMANN